MACEHLVTMRTPEGVEKCATCNETIGAPLATPPVDMRDETLRGLGYHDLRAFVVARVGLLDRERKLLTALSRQLDDATAQHGSEALQRYMGQAQHIRGEVLNLRNERLGQPERFPCPACQRFPCSFCAGTGFVGPNVCQECKGTGREPPR